jgi:hypothetical protein
MELRSRKATNKNTVLDRVFWLLFFYVVRVQTSKIYEL